MVPYGETVLRWKLIFRSGDNFYEAAFDEEDEEGFPSGDLLFWKKLDRRIDLATGCFDTTAFIDGPFSSASATSSESASSTGSSATVQDLSAEDATKKDLVFEW